MKSRRSRWIWPYALVAIGVLAFTMWAISTDEPFPVQISSETSSKESAQTPDAQEYSVLPKPPYTIPPGVEPKGGSSELSPEEAAQEQEELLEEQTKVLLVPLLRTDAPPERVLKDLVSLSCSQPASNYPFWDMANEIYQRGVTRGRYLLIRDWPSTLALAYNDECVVLEKPTGMAL